MQSSAWVHLIGIGLISTLLLPAGAQLRITEVMTCNATTLHDAQGKTPDWMELTWEGNQPVNLSAYGLRTGRKSREKAWSFPEHVLRPGERLIVLASGRDHWSDGVCEVPFRLSAKGERLELVGDDGHVLEIPPLPADVAYGYPELSMLERPTPGEPNAAAIGAPPHPPIFSRGHGFVSKSFELEIKGVSAVDTIRYTLDGSAPSPAHGQVYERPLRVDRSLVVRAVALREGHLPSRVTTASYLFPKQLVKPSRNAPQGWPRNRFIQGQKMVYGMEAPATIGATQAELLEGLSALPAVSLAIDLEDLLGRDRGIYTHGTERGLAWERPVSLEWIDPRDGGGGYQADAGLRLRGGFSRRGKAPKHAFRVIARSRYGQESFDWPFFGASGPWQCRTVDLRTPQNHSWANDGSLENTFLRDAFCRDTQGDLGRLHTRGRWVNLFLNGVYWGLYQTHERVDAEFGARYKGGDAEEFDVIKVGRPGILQTHVAVRDGDLEAWHYLWESVNRLAAQDEEAERLKFYRRLQGLDAEGIRDPDKPVYLDVDNLIDYMMIILFTGNNDAPISYFFKNVRPNNWFALRNRDGSHGFQFIVHDSEHSLGLPEEASDNRVGPFPGGATFENSNPQWIHQQLMSVAAYREAFADRAEALLSRGGALSAEACLRRLAPRIAEVEPAISLHAARWGGARSHPPRTKRDWRGAVVRLQEFLEGRPEIFRRQLQGGMRYALGEPGQHLILAPLYPLVAAPQVWRPLVKPAIPRLTAEEGALHYTIDGADPRVAGEGLPTLEPGRLRSEILVGEGDEMRFLARRDGESIAGEWMRPEHDDSQWDKTMLGSGLAQGEELDLLVGERYLGQRPLSSAREEVYVRAEFTLADLPGLVDLRLWLHYEDGYVAYINGREVARRDAVRSRMPAEIARAEAIDLGGHASLLLEGRNVLALRVLRRQGGGRPFTLRPQMEAKRVSGGEPPRLPSPEGALKARVRKGETWSALALFQPAGPVERASAENIVISEIMYHPPDLSPAEIKAGVEDPDVFEFVEFLNIGERPVSLDGARFIDGIQFQFDDRTPVLPSGEHLVLAKTPRLFALRYGDVTPVLGPYAGGLKNGGERLTLLDSRGRQILRFRYEDDGSWPSSADGLGFSLTLVDSLARNPPGKASTWRASTDIHGSPGRADPGNEFSGIVINEILTNSDPPLTDAIELYNPGSRTVDIGGWFLTDDVKEPEKWRIPMETQIPPKGFWVAYEGDASNSENNDSVGVSCFGSAFSLSSYGEEVYLFSADPEGSLTGYAHGFEFDALPPGIAFGRSVNSAGKEVFALCRPTLGKANGLPLLGPVVISEVFYHPEETDAAESTEFVEIFNRTEASVPLFDPERPENVWELKGMKFSFPPGQTLEGGECAVVVRMDPEAFRTAHGLSPEVKIYGPFSGALKNSGERLTLVRPVSDEKSDALSIIPMVPVDSLRYNDKSPWPEAADGSGRSLERLDASGITDEPRTWRPSLSPGGSPGRFSKPKY